jgi:hypothetical protein
MCNGGRRFVVILSERACPGYVFQARTPTMLRAATADVFTAIADAHAVDCCLQSITADHRISLN